MTGLIQSKPFMTTVSPSSSTTMMTTSCLTFIEASCTIPWTGTLVPQADSWITYTSYSSIVHVLYLSKNAKKSFCEISLLIACFHFSIFSLLSWLRVLLSYICTGTLWYFIGLKMLSQILKVCSNLTRILLVLMWI